MGCGGSILAAPTLAALVPLDDKFAKTLQNGDILLLDADWLRETKLESVPFRQELEKLRAGAFLAPEEASKILRAGQRDIGALTYGWRHRGNPDPDGAYLRAVQDVLRHPSCAHIKAFFWDFASLYQHPPGGRRTAEQDASFARALDQMAHVYASVVGTTVLRHAAVPPCEGGNPTKYYERGWPNFETAVAEEGLARAEFFPKLAAELSRLPPKLIDIGDGAPRPVTIEAVKEGAGPRIEANIQRIEAATFIGKGDAEKVVKLYRGFSTAISNALGTAGGWVMEGEYEGARNAAGQPHGRGAVRFADGAVYEGEFKAGKQKGRGKMRYANGSEYEGQWKEGKKEGRGTYRSASGDVYEGQWKADKREGRGTYRHPDGGVYEGEFKAGEMDGHGTERFASGNVYEGEYVAGNREGRGTFRYAGGEADVGRYRGGADVGEGARWSADRKAAWRLQDGEAGKPISLLEAAGIAAEIGLVPPAAGLGKRGSRVHPYAA